MIITSKIQMDLARPGIVSHVDAVQDDKYSRDIQILLYSGGAAWEIPTGVTVLVRYVKHDGTGGEYDTLPDGTAAFTAEGNALNVRLAPQVLTVAGPVRMAVTMLYAGAELSTFALTINVHRKPGFNGTSENYNYAVGYVPQPTGGAAVGQLLRIDEVVDGKITKVSAVGLDLNLNVSGVPADAKAVGAKMGDLTALNTTNKLDLVSAINEVRDELGDSDGCLPQPSGEIAVGQLLRIEEVVDGKVTKVSAVAAPSGSSVTIDPNLKTGGAAADAKSVGDRLGDLAKLETADRSNLVAAINEVAAANLGATTTVQDGTITQEKLSDELIAKLGLEPNHHLTEVKLTLHRGPYNSWWMGTDTGSSTSTDLFKTPQYIRVVNNHTCDIKNAGIRFADSSDYETAVFTPKEELGKYHQMGYFSETIAAGDERIIPTFEYGSKSREYMQIFYQPTDWNKAWESIEIFAIYDTWRPTYHVPSDSESKEIFLEDLPMRWIVSSITGAEVCGVYCAVPYYPDFTYHIRGGYYANITVNSIIPIGIFDDITAFDTTQPCIVGMSGNISNINAYRLDTEFGRTTQYDTSVNAGKDKNYAWAYFKTPPEEEHTGLKWLLFQFNVGYTAEGSKVTGQNLTKEIAAYMVEQWLSKGVQYEYVSRWENKDLPRKPTTQMRLLNPNLYDDGTIYQAFQSQNLHSPLVGSRWVLFGDSLTDNYGGHDRASQYFAAKIANEFNLAFDNRAKSGSNIYAGGSGNYTSVSGIVMLDAYLAEIEAGTTEQADYITVAFGTNTFGAQMGTNEDTSETNTSVYGATKYFIENIREKVPNAVLGFVLSPRQDWGSADPSTVRDVDGGRAAIKAVCDEYGVPYIDMSTQSGITVAMLPDGIHISSDQSQKLYYHAMRRFMMGL